MVMDFSLEVNFFETNSVTWMSEFFQFLFCKGETSSLMSVIKILLNEPFSVVFFNKNPSLHSVSKGT